jgi:hypothetical protein
VEPASGNPEFDLQPYRCDHLQHPVDGLLCRISLLDIFLIFRAAGSAQQVEYPVHPAI